MDDMNECICNSCNNLKQLIDEETGQTEYVCKYGYPSESCDDCNGECDITECSHYVADTDEIIRKVFCSGCGTELTQAYDDDSDGEVFCINCYLKK